MAGYAGWTMSTVALMLALNVLLNTLLIPFYGAVGAAIATLTSGLVVGIVKAGLIYRLDEVHTYSRSLAAFVGAAGGVLVLTAAGAIGGLITTGALLLVTVGLILWHRHILKPAVRRLLRRGREMVNE